MFCPKCGANNPDNTLFCDFCGESLNPDEAEQPELPAESDSVPQPDPQPVPQPVQQPASQPLQQPDKQPIMQRIQSFFKSAYQRILPFLKSAQQTFMKSVWTPLTQWIKSLTNKQQQQPTGQPQYAQHPAGQPQYAQQPVRQQPVKLPKPEGWVDQTVDDLFSAAISGNTDRMKEILSYQPELLTERVKTESESAKEISFTVVFSILVKMNERGMNYNVLKVLDQFGVNYKTTLSIAHRLSTLRDADRLIVIDNGRIVEEGTHAELDKNEEGIFHKLNELQNKSLAVTNF